jgi:aryl-alcohol dehydrogenase-like predicted oxidoreductase
VEYAHIGGLRVSRLALGTMLFGDKTPPSEAERILDVFLDAGGTLVDTADVYVDGRSEEVLAPWLARHRDQVVLATKVRFEVSDPGGSGLAPDRIVKACDASLRRMGVDVIDLYQVHAPDPDVPLEDSLEALDGLVRAGKVRELGASNFPAWLLAWAVALQDRERWAPFVSLQPQYSLIERSVEREILPFCRAAGLGVLPWGPLGAGFLTGRYRRGEAPPPDSRIGEATGDLEEAPARRATERNFAVADAVAEVARERDVSQATVALAWLLHQPGVTAPIHGARTLEHLTDVLGAAELELSPDQLARLDAPSAPAATYPERFLAEQIGLAEQAPLRRRDTAAPGN